jgi:putative endopeptidase
MTDATKEAAQLKLSKLGLLIGYPDNWRDYDFEVDRATHTANVMAAGLFENKRHVTRAGSAVDRTEWLMPPQIVNAYYNANANNTALPAGILQPPFFGKDRLVAANLGGVGMVVGHELTHGFDDTGAQFDEVGNQRDWWQEADKKLFVEKGQCVVDQYAKLEALPGQFVNGKLTLGENIADLGGVKMAYRAYQALRAGAEVRYEAEGFNEDQMFFLAVGQAWCSKDRDDEAALRLVTDPHSPPRFRVNGAVKNLPDFAKAFSCEAGAAMAPTDRCEVW